MAMVKIIDAVSLNKMSHVFSIVTSSPSVHIDPYYFSEDIRHNLMIALIIEYTTTGKVVISMSLRGGKEPWSY